MVECLASYPGFVAIVFAAYGTMKVCRCYGRGNAEVKKPEYEGDNFRVSRHGGSVVNGF